MTAPAEHQSQQRVLVPRRKIFDGLERSDSEEYILISRVGHDPKRLPERPQNRLTNYEARAFLRRDLGIPDSMRFPLGYGLLGLKKVVMSPVSSLTHQVVRGREITVTENPGQRLVWNNRRILIKPLPMVKTSTKHYRYLIQYPSQFALAVSKGLVPIDRNQFRQATDDSSDVRLVDFASFIELMEDFEVDDADVSRRFQYGDLRLSRLNFWAKFVLQRFAFFKAHGNHDA